jgi:hypothetical protein
VFLRTEKKKRELVEHAESPRPSTPIVLPTLSAPPAKQSSAAVGSLKEQDIQPDGPKGNPADSEEQRQSRLEDQLKESRSYSPVASNEVIVKPSNLYCTKEIANIYQSPPM